MTNRTALFSRHQPGGVFTIEDVIAHPGAIFFVHSGTGTDGAGYGRNPDAPLATLDYAIGLCTANKGDVIYLMPGHAETLAADAAVILDIAGVRVIGLGTGSDRPTFTFTHADAEFAFNAANVEIANIVCVCNVASLVAFFTLGASADGAHIRDCEFREGTQTGLDMILISGAADDVRIERCSFYAPTAGNYDRAIRVGAVVTRLKVLDNFIYGDFDDAGISSGSAFTLADISRNRITNLQAGQHAIELTAAATGVLADNRLSTDAVATSLDPGSMRALGNLWNATGDFEASPPLPAADSTNNLIGTDDADNAATTTNVVANRDGSVLERLEALMDPAGAYIPGLGFRVTKTSDLASDPDDLFDVTGKILITLMTGEVTTVVATTTTAQLVIKTSGEALTAATTITTDADGTMYLVSGDFGDTFNGGSTPTANIADGNGKGPFPFVVGNAGGSLTIEQDLDGAGTGAIAWTLYYLPLESGASVAAAA